MEDVSARLSGALAVGIAGTGESLSNLSSVDTAIHLVVHLNTDGVSSGHVAGMKAGMAKDSGKVLPWLSVGLGGSPAGQ